MQEYKLELGQLEIFDIFQKAFYLFADTARIGLKEQIEEKGVDIIKELNDRYRDLFKKLDKKIPNV